MAAAYSKINDSSQAARQATLLRILSHWVTGTHNAFWGSVRINIFGSSGVVVRQIVAPAFEGFLST